MASREERMQQRLRGSQRRQVKDVDFGLSFPIAPAEPSFPPSAPHISPQAQLPPSELRESIQTPTARQSSLRSSVRLSHSTSANDANTSAKRRKLDTDSAPSSSRSTRSGIRNAPRRDVNTVEEISRDEEEGGEAQESYELEPTDVEISMGMNASHGEGHDGGLDEDPGDASLLENSIDEEPSVEVTEGLEPEITAAAVSSTMASRARTKSPLPLAKSFVDLVTESPRNAPGSGRRTRVALQANSLHTDSQLSEITQELRERTTTTQKKRKRAEDAKPVLRRHQTQTPSALDELDELSPDRPARQSRNAKVVDEEVDERSPEQPAHRDRKAKTVEDQGDYMDEEVDELSPEQPARRGQKAKITVEDPVGHMDENTRGLDGQDAAEEIDDEQAAVVLKKNQSRRTSSRFAAASPELGSSAISSFKTPTFRKPNGRPRVDQSPAQQRHPKKAPSKPTSKAAKKTANKQHVRAGEPIDIVVHRLVGVPIYDENETDAEILNAEIPHIKRAGVNTIDVLSEVSQEIIDSGLNTLEDMGNGCQDKAARREYKTKYDAVESFKRELHVRLLEHTTNLDSACSLERRVRDEQRKKLGLREEILRVRREREQVALRMDEIRTKHEKEKDAAQGRDSLNAAVHDLELAIDMGKSAPRQPDAGAGKMVGIELLVKRVASEVSSKADGGGFLSRVREFNAFLERAALALERRRV